MRRDGNGQERIKGNGEEERGEGDQKMELKWLERGEGKRGRERGMKREKKRWSRKRKEGRREREGRRGGKEEEKQVEQGDRKEEKRKSVIRGKTRYKRGKGRK